MNKSSTPLEFDKPCLLAHYYVIDGFALALGELAAFLNHAITDNESRRNAASFVDRLTDCLTSLDDKIYELEEEIDSKDEEIGQLELKVDELTEEHIYSSDEKARLVHLEIDLFSAIDEARRMHASEVRLSMALAEKLLPILNQ